MVTRFLSVLFASATVLGCTSSLQDTCIAATIPLYDGDDLRSVIRSAQHQDTIELRSNGSFQGGFGWSDKYLTIQAGSGFSPTIEGSVGRIVGNSNTGASFRNLTITGGLASAANGTRFSNYEFLDTTFIDGVRFGGTGKYHIDLVALDSTFLGGLRIKGTGSSSVDAIIRRSTIDTFFDVSPVGSSTSYNIEFVENDVLTRAYAKTGTTPPNLEYHRNRFIEGLEIESDGKSMNLTATNNVFGGVLQLPATDSPGLLFSRRFPENNFSKGFNAVFNNNTISGFDIGIEMIGRDPARPDRMDLQFTNMLLANSVDAVGIDPNSMSFSLVSNSAFVGINGNFSGTPLLGPDGQLLLGSPGIDAGNNSTVEAFDFSGNTRVLDGNGDGIPVVDVGAYELAIPEPSSIVVIAIGVLPSFCLRNRILVQ